MPGYLKSAQFTAWYTNQTAQFKIIGSKAYIRFVHCKELFCIGNADLYKDMKYVKTEVKPSHGRYDVLVTFDDKKMTRLNSRPFRIIQSGSSALTRAWTTSLPWSTTSAKNRS